MEVQKQYEPMLVCFVVSKVRSLVSAPGTQLTKMEEYNKWVESGGMEELLFSLGEKPEKSSRDENPNKESKPKKKKKKGKNK